MTLRLIEGFDHYTGTGNLALKGWQWIPGGGISGSFPAGRVNGNCFSIDGVIGSGSTPRIEKYLPVVATTGVFGFAINPHSGPGPTYPMSQIAQVMTAGGVAIATLGLDAAGRVTCGGVTGTTTFPTGAWFYVEWKLVIAGASGSFTVNVNGGPEITTTVANLGTAPIGGVRLITTGNSSNIGGTASYDDVYFLDNAGPENNDFLGDRHVETLYPNAAGAHTVWTPDSGSNYARTNEHAVDGDTSYVSTSNVGDVDAYNFDDLSIPSADIRGLQVNLWARKFDATLRQVAPVLRPTTTDYVGNTQTLATSYVDLTTIYENNPDTSADWTVAQINAAQFGIKLVT